MAVVLHGDVRAGAAAHREVTAASVQTTFTPGLDHLAGFADEWEQVYAAAGNEPTNAFEWTQAVIRHRGQAHRHVGIVRLHRSDAAVGFVALVARTSNVLRIPCTILRPACELKNTHSDLLLAERSPAAVAALVDQIAGVEGWDCFRVDKVLASNPIGELLCDAARAHGWSARVSFSRAAYYLLLPASFEAYFASRSAKFRNHARRTD